MGLWDYGLWDYGLWDYGLWDYGLWDYGLWDYGLWDYGLWDYGLAWVALQDLAVQDQVMIAAPGQGIAPVFGVDGDAEGATLETVASSEGAQGAGVVGRETVVS